MTPQECFDNAGRILQGAEGETDRGLMELNMSIASLWISLGDSLRAMHDD